MDDTKLKNTEAKIKETLAVVLGVEPEDIHDDDSFETDLHMDPTQLADFSHNLEQNGVDTSDLDFNEIETVEDLVEILANN
jgi:acyl carrier protein